MQMDDQKEAKIAELKSLAKEVNHKMCAVEKKICALMEMAAHRAEIQTDIPQRDEEEDEDEEIQLSGIVCKLQQIRKSVANHNLVVRLSHYALHRAAIADLQRFHIDKYIEMRAAMNSYAEQLNELETRMTNPFDI